MKNTILTLRTKLCKSLKYMLAVLALTAALNAVVTAQGNTGGASPLAVTGGAPAGSYALSDFDTVNLFNGSLNFRLPLLSMGGRGGAQHTVSLPIERKWIAEKYWDPGIQGNIWYFTDYEPGVLVPKYTAGVLHGYHGLFYPQVCAANNEETYLYTLTKMVFTTSDGTEHELLDTNNFGNVATVQNCNPTRYNRGRIFKSNDGSGITFISDTDIVDYYTGVDPSSPFLPTGYLLLDNGTRMRIEDGTVRWKRDRNGNKVTFSYDGYLRPQTIADSLGRVVTINYAVNDGAPYGISDQIIYSGFGGTQKVIRVSYTDLNSALRTTQQGDSQSVQTCLNLYSGSGYYNPTVVSSVWLPDGRRYRLFYNCFGEVARVVLPTGGAIEYDHGAGLENASPYGDFEKYSAYGGTYPQVYRRVRERRVYPDGTTLASKMIYGRQEIYNSSTLAITNQGYADVDQRDANGSLLNRSRHYFTSSASPSLNESPFYQPTDWGASKEWKTELFSSNGSTLLRRVTTSWGGGTVFGQGPHILETVTTLADTNQVAKQTFSYDQYNNQTDVYEYDYGAGTAGALVRRSHTDYLTTNPVNGADYTSNSIHIRGLVRAQQVYSVNPSTGAQTLAAQSEIRYDEYPLYNYGSVFQWADPGATRANATTMRKWLDTNNTWLENRIEYDQVGNVKESWDARTDKTEAERVTQIEYSSTYHYSLPTHTLSPIPDLNNQSSTNTPLETWTTYDFYTGKVTETRDANNFATTYQYNDVLDRPTQIQRPDGGWTNYIYGSLSYGDYIRTQTALNATQTMEHYQFFDGLGRGVRSFQYDGSQYITVDTQYDALGRAWRVSNPYLSAGSTSAINPSGRWTTTAYDALGRVLTMTTPDSAQAVTSYSGNTLTVTDQAGKSRRSVTDALGRLTQVVEDPSGLAYQTNYTYDALDNLRLVAQGVQQRYFMYDSLSRLIRARNPEQNAYASLNTSPDPISGNTQWSMAYAYDNNSNLSVRTDARGVVASYQYDNINRVTQVSYNDGTPWSFFRYDFAVNGRGRSYNDYDNSTSGGYNHVTHYDSMGRPTRRQTDFYLLGTGWVGSYVSTRVYDKAGNVISQTYPSGHTVNYDQFDVAGRLKNFTGNLGNGATRTYATGITYDEAGRLQREQYGTTTPLYHKLFYNIRGQLFDVRLSSVNDTWDWNRGRLIFYYSSNHVWGQSGTDNNGNVRFVENWIPPPNATLDQAESLTEHSYTYDSLNRVSAVNENRMSAAGGWTWAQQFAQSYSYDRYGNRTINAAQTWGAGINSQQFAVDANTNRLSVPSGYAGVMQYDAAGNLINDTYSGMGSRTYDAENRMTTAWGSGAVQSIYTYDPAGQRTRRSTGGVTTWQIYGMDGELLAEYAQGASPSQPQKEYGYRSGELLVVAESNGQIQWLIGDHLGTPRMIADQTGSLAGIKRHDYLPFGEELFAGTGGRTTAQGYVGNADGVRQRFTSKERDDETGLDYFLARYYSSAQGRFTSPDEFTGGAHEVSAEVLGPDPLLYAEQTEPQSFNKYTYCLNNPLRYIDPDGHQTEQADRLISTPPLIGPIIFTADTALTTLDIGKGITKSAVNMALGAANLAAGFTGGEQTPLLQPSNRTQDITMSVTDTILTFGGLLGGRTPVGVMTAEAKTTTVVASQIGNAERTSGTTSVLRRSVATKSSGTSGQKTTTTVTDPAGSTTYKTTPGRTGGQSTMIIRKDSQGNVKYVKQEARHRTKDFNKRPDHVHYKRPKNKEVY